MLEVVHVLQVLSCVYVVIRLRKGTDVSMYVPARVAVGAGGAGAAGAAATSV